MARDDKGKKQKRPVRSLKTIQPDAAGIDLGAREHWAAGPPLQDNTPNVERFGTTTPELLRLADWLKDQGVKPVAMESTGVYWIPLFEILECSSSQPCPRPKDRYDRLSMASTASRLWLAAWLVPAFRRHLSPARFNP